MALASDGVVVVVADEGVHLEPNDWDVDHGESNQIDLSVGVEEAVALHPLEKVL